MNNSNQCYIFCRFVLKIFIACSFSNLHKGLALHKAVNQTGEKQGNS